MPNETPDKLPIARLSPFAEADLREIWRYISDSSREFADKTIDELLQKFKFLASNQKLGRSRHDLIVNLRLFPFKKYSIFYFPTKDGIEIYRVLHGSRDVVQVFDDAIDDIK